MVIPKELATMRDESIGVLVKSILARGDIRSKSLSSYIDGEGEVHVAHLERMEVLVPARIAEEAIESDLAAPTRRDSPDGMSLLLLSTRWLQEDESGVVVILKDGSDVVITERDMTIAANGRDVDVRQVVVQMLQGRKYASKSGFLLALRKKLDGYKFAPLAKELWERCDKACRDAGGAGVPKRHNLIERISERLDDGYNEEQIRLAIEGMLKNPYYLEQGIYSPESAITSKAIDVNIGYATGQATKRKKVGGESANGGWMV